MGENAEIYERLGRIEQTVALDEKRAEYIQKRDAAALPTTKAIYQAIIDRIDEKLEGN